MTTIDQAKVTCSLKLQVAQMTSERRIIPNVIMSMSMRNYTIKTVDSAKELQQALQLRYEVFRQEMIGQPDEKGTDFDEYDEISDHLILVDDRIDQVVGTYRLISSAFSSKFYSASEFDLGDFLTKPGIKLELSRACIDKKHRNGLTLTLLWKGVVAYAKKTDAKYLFGCSSVWTTDKAKMFQVVKYLNEKNAFANELAILPRAKYEPEFNFHSVDNNIAGEVLDLIPPLLKSYLKTGAKLGAVPALDKEFNCYDFFTMLDLENVAYVYERKYL